MKAVLSPPAVSRLPLRPERATGSRLAEVEALARWLDYAFVLPGGFRFGLAGIVGLLPGVGDAIDALLSLYIVVLAIRSGIPRVAIFRMMINVAIEALAGAVPIAGDLFIVAFKANRRNYLLLRDHLSERRNQNPRDWLFLLLMFVLAGCSVALPMIGVLFLVKHL